MIRSGVKMKKRGREKFKGEQQLQAPEGTNAIMTVYDMAQYLSCHPSTVYRLLKRGDIPAFHLGSDWRFSARSIDRWIVGRQVAADEGNGAAMSNPKD
jgi:excisionase family DNA binding protein